MRDYQSRCLAGWLMVLFSMLTLAITTLAQKPSEATAAKASRVDRVEAYCPVIAYEVHDVDTVVKATLQLPFNTLRNRLAIRDATFDGYEVSRVRQTVKITDEELAKGRAARDKLIEVLKTRYELQASEPPEGWKDIDPYDRLDAQLWLYERSTGQRISLRKWALENDAVRSPDKRPAK